MQVRDEWLGFVVGLVIWGFATGRIRRFVIAICLLGSLLTIGYISDFEISSPRGRGEKFSARTVIGRAVSVADRDTAAQLTDEANAFAGTVSWRRNWWQAIWQSVHQEGETVILGHGYGFRLTDLVPYLEGEAIRTPHNDFYYALGYTGWIGVLIFYLFLLTILTLVWRVFRLTAQPLGIVLFGAALSQSFFGNLFETPFGAIPLYLLLGLVIAPLLSTTSHPRLVEC